MTAGGSAIVLCYHAVSPSWRSSLAVSPELLERQLSSLVSRGWRGCTFSEAVFDPPTRRSFAVTFDDAFASVLRLAAPVLAALDLPATVFAPTDFMSTRQRLRWPGIEQWADTPDADELLSMNWDDLRTLADGGWEIGSHTQTHPHLTRLDDAAVTGELTRSRELCSEALGRDCTTLAYPYGDADVRIGSLARMAGYRLAAMLGGRHVAGDPYRYPRVGIYSVDEMWRFRLKVSPLTRGLRRTALWPTS